MCRCQVWILEFPIWAQSCSKRKRKRSTAQIPVSQSYHTCLARTQSEFALVEKRVSRLAQLRSCLVEILVLVNEVCAASPSNAIIGFYEARHLIHENAPECVGRDGANQQFQRTRLAARKKADGCPYFNETPENLPKKPSFGPLLDPRTGVTPSTVTKTLGTLPFSKSVLASP